MRGVGKTKQDKTRQDKTRGRRERWKGEVEGRGREGAYLFFLLLFQR